ncbi:MAG: hypothetical protein ABSH20_05920 [Tepidisphaeraceae bacterium]|jgi:Tfp pilus assembly protein PilW
MTTAKRERTVSRTRRGLTLIDAMMSLTICALLLGAISAAFAASSQAITANDQFTRCAQSCRVAVDQIMAEVRKADAVQVGTTSVDVIRPDGSECTYAYNAATGSLTVTLVGDPTTHTLASSVTTCSFVADIQPDPKTQINRVVRVTTTITITIGQNTVTLGGSAAPRRALVY